MEQEVSPELTAEDAALLEPDIGLGQNRAFGLIAGRCSAAQAEGLRRLHDENQYTKMH
jgi:hypothetical protein